MPSTPSTNNPYTLEHAVIDWQNTNTPTSREYDDIYFSKQEGLAETQYVFLQHNQLAERWQQLQHQPAGTFTIAETGFGTGLNFLAAWQLWQQHAPKHWQLHFITVEKHPLLKNDLERSLTAWPELQPLSQQLVQQYPALIPGHHVLSFNSEAAPVHLHLLFGDAEEGFEQCIETRHPDRVHNTGAKVDAWFLDGFAPSKNPSMWTETLFNSIGQLSKPETTVATFTAAGMVRRGLSNVGFHIKKVSGYGHKREMITGIYKPNNETIEQGDEIPTTKPKIIRSTLSGQTPWHIPASSKKPQQAIIIGGGISGCSSAYALAQRGIEVTIIERHAQLAQEASGNAQGMLYTKLSPLAGKLNQFTLGSYFYALRFYQQLLQNNKLSGKDIEFCGLLQLCQGKKQQALLTELEQCFSNHSDWVQCLTAEQASELSGVHCPSPGYFLSGSGWLSPTALCQQLTQHPLISIKTHNQAMDIKQTSTGWQILNAENKLIDSAQTVIIANNHDALAFQQTQHLPLKVIRGQVTEVHESAAKQLPKTVICHEGYITPAIDKHIRFGATFGLGDEGKELRYSDHKTNVDNLHKTLPSFFNESPESLLKQPLTGRANLRCTSPDYLPLVGPAPIAEQFINDYNILRKDANRVIDTQASYYAGLFINVAHGARGLCSTPLCSELLAALICNEPRPLGRDLSLALNPARFLIKDIIRGKLALK